MEKKNDAFSSLAIVVCTAILFSRTSDVMSFFAPAWIGIVFGLDANSASTLFGWVNAAMVEGEILALHFHPGAHGHAPAQWVKWILIGISAACQIFDGSIITNTMSRQSEMIKIVFSTGVPLIPLLVLIMIALMGRLPTSTQDKKPFKFIGLRNIPNKFRWIIEGTENTHPSRTPNAQSMTINNSEINKAILEEKEKIADPTFGSNGKNHR